MAFSAVTGKSVRLSDGQLQSHVTVTNDANGQTFEDDLSYQPGSDLASTQKNLEARVRARIDQAKREASSKQIALLPVGTVLDLSVPGTTPVTQAQIDQSAFLRDCIARIQQKKADALDADLKARLLPEYIPFLP